MAKKNLNNQTAKKKKRVVTEISRTEVGYDANDEIWNFIGIFLLIVCGAILVCCIDDETNLNQTGRISISILTIVGIYLVFLRKLFRKRRLARVPKMLPEGIRYKWPLGIEKIHSYEEWADSINDGHFTIGPRAFEFRLGIEKLSFFYNVGNASERVNTQEAYKYFTEKLQTVDPMIVDKLPKFTKSNIDLLDKKCFYHRSRRNQLFVMCCNMVVFLGLGSIGGMQGVLISSIVCGFVEALAMAVLAKGAYYNYKNELALREALPDITGLIKDDGIGVLRPYWGYIYLVIIFAVNYFIQYTLIWW